MTTINLIRNDIGIQNLERQNEAAPVADDVEAIEPYPSIKPSSNLGNPIPKRSERRQQPPQARGPDRRRYQRRRRHQAVLLDTRAPHERRQQNRRDNDLKQIDAEQPTILGIDRRV